MRVIVLSVCSKLGVYIWWLVMFLICEEQGPKITITGDLKIF